VHGHTAAGKLQGLTSDALWYEAALLVGITNALNVVADSPLGSLESAETSADAEAVYAEIRAFYSRAVPVPFLRLAGDAGEMRELERNRLALETGLAENVRLSCQVRVHDDLKVRVVNQVSTRGMDAGPRPVEG